jgi:hypothetical protein
MDAIKNKKSFLPGVLVLILSGAAFAAPVQTLLQEDFQGVSVATSTTVLTIATVGASLDGNPVTSFLNTGNGDASNNSFNVRRGDNALDGSSAGSATFDNYFGTSANHFLVIGDDSGNLGGAANGGTTATPLASSTMNIGFALEPFLMGRSKFGIEFDYVFDANNAANTDDFLVQLILSDGTAISLLSYSAPSATSRGTYASSLVLEDTSVLWPAFLSFTLIEQRNGGSSAVGLDNITITAVALPEPGVLGLFGLGLLGMAAARRRRA